VLGFVCWHMDMSPLRFASEENQAGGEKRRRQDVTRNRGRMSLDVFLHTGKPPPCFPHQRLIVTRRLLIGLDRDGSSSGAGDGTRTRDSLLGRQIVARLPLACFRRALEEPSPIAHAIQAALRQMVARVGRQMVLCFPSHHTLFFSRMQALWEKCSI
jgi:hypothetical protein